MADLNTIESLNSWDKKQTLPPEVDLSIENGKLRVRESLNNLRGYSAYTTNWDEEIHADELVEAQELHKLHKYFIDIIQPLIPNGIEEEMRSVINDFIMENHLAENPLSTSITLLLDNSWSMRGAPILYQALIVYLLSQQFEDAEIPFEVLWFTTRAWKWWRAFQKWIQDGKTANPGRLNDLRHIIYKSADEKFKQTNFWVLMREWLLKENIDGEALVWAYERLRKRTENNKILLHISDGAPIDDATQSQNRANFLNDHLNRVTSQLQAKDELSLHMINFGDRESSNFITQWYESIEAFNVPDGSKISRSSSSVNNSDLHSPLRALLLNTLKNILK